MQSLGRSLIVLGLAIAVIGLAVMAAGKIPFVGRLPGDIFVKRDHFTFFFPIATCLLISLVLTLIFRMFGRK